MRLRDAPYARSSVIYVVAGVAAPAIERLDVALRSYVSHPASTEFRAFLGRNPSDEAIDAATREAIVRLDEDLDPAGLIVRARRLGFGVLPTRLVATEDAVAVAVNHGVMDGGPILEFVTWLMTAAANGTPTRDEREPVRFPLVKGVRKAGRSGVQEFLEARRKPQLSPPRSHTPTPEDLSLQNARFATLSLDETELRRVAALPSSGRSSTNTRLVSVAIAALARVYTGTEDVPVGIPVDLRRFVKNGRVLGNFIGVDAPTPLLAGDWSPAAITTRLVESARSGAAMITVGYSVLRWLRYRPTAWLRRGRSGQGGAGDVSVFVPLLITREGFPDELWRPGGRAIIGATTIMDWPSSTTLGVLQFRQRAFACLWDESGLFDVDEFPRAFESEVAARAAASSSAPQA